MQPTGTPTSCPEHFDLDRIAFAVDALTVGVSQPLLIHVAQIRGRGTTIVFEALPEVELSAINARPRTDDCGHTPWRVAGIAAPVRVRADATSSVREAAAASSNGWMVHLVERGGRRATRLWQPDEIGTERAMTGEAGTQGNDRVVPIGGPVDDLCCRLLDMTT